MNTYIDSFGCALHTSEQACINVYLYIHLHLYSYLLMYRYTYPYIYASVMHFVSIEITRLGPHGAGEEVDQVRPESTTWIKVEHRSATN